MANITTIFISIVTFNSELYLEACINSILNQKKLRESQVDLKITVIDNGSSDKTIDILSQYKDKIIIVRNKDNLGYSAGHNQGVEYFLKDKGDIFIALNPDIILSDNFISILVNYYRVINDPLVGAFTPKIFRFPFNEDSSYVIDACGMYLTPTLRHFDRGSQTKDRGEFNEIEVVFGGTGACLCLTRRAIEEASFRADLDDHILRVWPVLASGKEKRQQLFDEGFFAYREDADLAWRFWRLGIKTLFLPDLICWHKRGLRDRRCENSSFVNMLGVQNRFLLQANNYSIKKYGFFVFVSGFLYRNIVVILGVFFTEFASIRGIINFLKLYKRARARYYYILAREKPTDINWFKKRGVSYKIKN